MMKSLLQGENSFFRSESYLRFGLKSLVRVLGRGKAEITTILDGWGYIRNENFDDKGHSS